MLCCRGNLLVILCQEVTSVCCLKANFDCHLKVVCEMEEVGDSVARVDTLIKEAVTFQKLCGVSRLTLSICIKDQIQEHNWKYPQKSTLFHSLVSVKRSADIQTLSQNVILFF